MAPPVELSRWLLQSRNIAFEFEARAPGLHAFKARRHGRPIELPLILTPPGAVGALWSSIQWLEERLGARETLFAQPGDSDFVHGLCTDLFSNAVKSYYVRMLPAPRLLIPGALAGVPWTDASFVRFLYPAWRRMMRAGLRLGDFDPDAAAAAIDTVFDRVEGDLGNRPFLHGDRPGIRDIVFAVLASPVILPDDHPVKLPRVEALPDGMRRLVERCRARPAGALALRTYGERPPVADYGKVPADRRGVLAALATPRLVRGAARAFAAYGPRRLRIGRNLFVGRWRDVDEGLRRDSDFLIAPVNAKRIEGVMGPFILGMDASPALHAQRESTYSALRDADKSGVLAILETEPARIAGDAARRFGKIDVVNLYARPVAARVAVALIGITGPTEQDLMRVTRAIFEETFLNLNDDAVIKARGQAAGKELAGWIAADLARPGVSKSTNLLGRLAALAEAGQLPPKQVAWIAAGLLVGAIDTTATCVANIVEEVIRDRDFARRIAADRSDPHLLAGWCWEALRRRPHNPLVLREAGAATTLAGGPVAGGTRLWALTLAAMQDPRVFSNPATLDPNRPRNLYMHFGHALHRCAGRGLNAIQIPALVGTLLDHGVAGPADRRSRGSFPDRLVVALERRP